MIRVGVVVVINLRGVMENQSKDAIIISAFPGTGKTYYYKNTRKVIVMDSDSSKWPKEGFPENYIKHIKENINSVDVIFVSTHKEVRDAMSRKGLEFMLVYPNRDLRDEYMMRYLDRGSDVAFVKLLYINWNKWLDELEDQLCACHWHLQRGEYISHIMSDILK